MKIEITSFGYKYGDPPAADIVLDARSLRNPYSVPELRDKDGRDKGVSDYVLENPRSLEYVESAAVLLARLHFFCTANESAVMRVAVGCTGGHHRSVAVSEMVSKMFRIVTGDDVILTHRELG